MAQIDGSINHVSDTALMVAACRATESERPDRFFSDPFAARLAGDRGRAILRDLPRSEIMLFGVAIRTRFLDELIMKCIGGRGIHTVLSIGCGLDARPWRLELPSDLLWIEADFADMLAYKEAALAADQPKCGLRRIPADLNDAAQRTAVFSSVEGPALMITEGLLSYLSAPTINALSTEPTNWGVRYWLTDLTSPAFAHIAGMQRYDQVQAMRAAGHLDGDGIKRTLESNGWRSAESRSYVTDIWSFAGERLKAAVASRAQSDPPVRVDPDDYTGIHLFTR